MKHTFTLDAARMYAMQHTAATKDIRYYLNGVCVERRNGRVILASTNGHIAGAMHCGESVGPDVAFIIPLDTIKKCKPTKGSTLVAVTYDDETKRIEIERVDGVLLAQAVDGKFPDWRRIVPTPQTDAEIGQFDPEMMTAFKKIATILGNTVCPRIHHAGTNGAALVSIGDDDFIGVAMPYNERKMPAVATRPAWLS